MNISKSFKHNRKTGVVILSLLLFNIPLQSQAMAATRESLSSLRSDISELQNQDQQATSQLVVTQVFIDDSGDTLVINGVNFDNGDLPVVELGGQELVVTSSDAQLITADLPQSFIDSSYLLTVSTGSQRTQFDSFELTLGAVGSQGLQGPAGPQGERGAVGPQGLPGTSVVYDINPRTFETITIPGFAVRPLNISCPNDSASIFGGYNSSSTQVVTVASYRTGFFTWRYVFRNLGAAIARVTPILSCARF